MKHTWHNIFHPKLTKWFTQTFKQPTEVQTQAWQAISKFQDVLISSPTGSGKTLAAFLYALNTLFSEPDNQQLSVLYISPLKALSNDVKINLEKPLKQLNQLFDNKNILAATWTGDTTQNERNKIRKKPPHILVTTPESLYTLLTAHSGRAILATIKTVIIDEVHAVANSKRGAHLTLSLQRLEALCLQRPQRIAISATKQLDTTLFPVKPFDVLAQQIVAEIAMQDWDRKQLFHLFTDNNIYQDMSEADFNQVIEMLAIGYGGNRQRQTAMIFHDKVTDQLRPRKVARLTAITNGGTIPDQFDYDVRLLPEDIKIGSLNEDFSL